MTLEIVHEWASKGWLFLHDIPAALAKWAIRQSPRESFPKDLPVVCGFLVAALQKEIKKLPEDDIIFIDDRQITMVQLSLCQINKYLHDIIGDLPQIKVWNSGKDFIDNSALFRNICVDIRDERRAEQVRWEEMKGPFPENKKQYPKNYREFDTCRNCKNAFIWREHDATDEAYCRKISTDVRPPSGSIALGEDEDEDDPKRMVERWRTWDAWAEKHSVSLFGKCDDWEAR